MENNYNGFSPYEQVKIGQMTSKHPSGTAIAGLVVGVGAAVLAGAAAAWAGSRAKAAKDVAKANNEGTTALLNRLANQYDQYFAAERQERIAGDVTLNQTITDTVSGSQQGTLSAQQAAELSAVNNTMIQTYSDFVTGRASLNPTPVSLYSAPQPCSCPNSCGCSR